MRRWRWLGGLALAALLLARPREASLGAAAAMAQWAESVAPALFPFLALMPLLTCEDAARTYEALLGRAVEALFGLPGAAASAMAVALAAGSPAGAMAARRVAVRTGMNRGQLCRLAAALSGFSPAFLVAGVGAGMLGDIALGWRLLASQLLTQLTLLALLRRAWRDRPEPVPPASEAGEAWPVRAAVLSALTICGYMALFQAVARAAMSFVGAKAAGALLCLLDAPSGARLVAGLPVALEGARPLLLAGVCGFGGACVAAQNLGALSGCGVRAGEYVAVRTLAAGIEVGWMALLPRLSPAGAARALQRAGERPFEAAGLLAALLALPALVGMKKSVS